jgi:hypothetical protein
MRRFLKYELDNYLRSRDTELVEEMPLVLHEDRVSSGLVVLTPYRQASSMPHSCRASRFRASRST